MDHDKRREAIAAYKSRKITGGVFCIKNTATGRILLQQATDLHGCKNRFQFEQMTDSCFDLSLSDDWKKYGGKVFCFELLETLERKETQSVEEFREDVATLFGIWKEHFATTPQY